MSALLVLLVALRFSTFLLDGTPIPQPFACDRTPGPDVRVPVMVYPKSGATDVPVDIGKIAFIGHRDDSIRIEVISPSQFIIGSEPDTAATDYIGAPHGKVIETKIPVLMAATRYEVVFKPFPRCRTNYEGESGFFTTTTAPAPNS